MDQGRSGIRTNWAARAGAIIFVLLTTLYQACKDDDTRGCITCSQPQTLDFEVCEEGDGNASVNGQNTGTPYDVYLADLVADGADCGGG